jgi:hypothetical protein
MTRRRKGKSKPPENIMEACFSWTVKKLRRNDQLRYGPKVAEKRRRWYEWVYDGWREIL